MITTKNDHHGYAAVKQTLKTISTVKKDCNYSAPKIPGIMQEFQQRQVLQLQRRLFHVFLLSRYKNGF